MRYQRKHGPAPWTQAFPEQVRPAPKARRKPPAPRKRVRSRSPGRSRQEREYAAAAREFLAEARRAGKTCPVVAAVPELREGRRYGHPISGKLTEVHHTRGRAGGLLLDRRYWLAVSKQGHRWIHSNPAAAREAGWLCPAGQWNTGGL